ncbi:MAG: hypothetical protein NWE95_13475 [Candidatus Bathyarchaeota archaeon]|nr:hypothetical protein [Candidatus Bathyarchaeota archaeon]
MEQKFINPLNAVGIAAVVTAYFLFTFHAMFTLSWIGEWEGLSEPIAFAIFVTDVTAGFFLAFRLIASIIAITTTILYFTKKRLSPSTTNKLLQWILVFEALYWIGLLPSGIWGMLSATNIVFLLNTGIPCLIASIGIPIALFKLAFKLRPNKPQREAIKWALIAGVLYIVAFWLNNTGMWITTASQLGIEQLIAQPELLVSFGSTVFGLLALAIFTGYFAKKSIGIESLHEFKIRTVGAILVALGLFYLWNYMTWIFFGGWNQWYAWLLGHNLDLWMLSLPLLGLPLLFHSKSNTEQSVK